LLHPSIQNTPDLVMNERRQFSITAFEATTEVP
jgi:hypothetical protein